MPQNNNSPCPLLKFYYDLLAIWKSGFYSLASLEKQYMYIRMYVCTYKGSRIHPTYFCNFSFGIRPMSIHTYIHSDEFNYETAFSLRYAKFILFPGDRQIHIIIHRARNIYQYSITLINSKYRISSYLNMCVCILPIERIRFFIGRNGYNRQF